MNEPFPEVSVVVPVFNEQENVPILWKSLDCVMNNLEKSWEVIWVDDGSTDRSLGEMQSIQREDSRSRVIALEDNHGQSTAILCGIQNSHGKIIITIDADLQNDPGDIPVLLSLIDDADMVIGWRRERQDPFSKRVSSRIANRFRNWITGENIPDIGCSLKVFRREIIENVFPFHGMHRFLPTLASLAGFRVVVVPVRHFPRLHGRSKYGIWNRFLGPLVDCLAVAWMKKRYIGGVQGEEMLIEQ